MKQRSDWRNETPVEGFLQSLIQDARCYFIDYRLVSKHTVYELTKEFSAKDIHSGGNFFVIHTCLRLEIYNFSGELNMPRGGFATLEGEMAIRRMLSLMVGTQSEIIGETEVLGQIKNAIANSAGLGLLAKNTFWDLLATIDLAENLRTEYNINCTENYSTIGAEIFDNLVSSDGEVLSVIGCGYMAEFFFRTLRKAKTSKIYWINRNVRKAKKIQKTIQPLDQCDIAHLSIDECRSALETSDFIFAAYKNGDQMFADCDVSKAKAVVDVSYPPLFADKCNRNFLSINNTFFERYVNHPVSKVSLLECEQKIDLLLGL